MNCLNKKGAYKVLSLTGTSLIVGNGPCAMSIAQNLLSQNADILLAAKDTNQALMVGEDTGGNAELLANTKLLGCQGVAENFSVLMDHDGRKITKAVSNIIIAEEAGRSPNFSLYGLTPGDAVLSLSQLIAYSQNPAEYVSLKGKKVLFLTGLADESTPAVLEEIMRFLLILQSDLEAQTYVLTQNLKVAGNGLDALYQETREAGAVYVKFMNTLPEIRQEESGQVVITFYDEIMQQHFRLTPDLTVVDEVLYPTDYLTDLTELLELEKDGNGFPQTDNVHRIAVSTNRRGIWVAGASRGILVPPEELADAGNVAISVIKQEMLAPETADRAEIETGRCARCLTCYRSCSYRAIALDPVPVVIPEACERCGVCAAVCPGDAIRLKGLEHQDIADQITDALSQPAFSELLESSADPFLVAFCCERSASQAGELAKCMGHSLPKGLLTIPVPCAGAISQAHLFSAFSNKADGVLVLTCHEGNCHSEHGNIYAHKKVRQISDLLSGTDFEKDRLIVGTLASNMGKEFADIVNGFEKSIRELNAGNGSR